MAADQTIQLTPPSVGTVSEVLVAKGDLVDRDQTLAVLVRPDGTKTSLYALYGGRIQSVRAKPEQKVSVGSALFSLDRLRADWVIAHVKSSAAKSLRAGMSARIAGTDLVGSIEEFGEEPDPGAETVAVGCLIPNERGHMATGRTVTVSLERPGVGELRPAVSLSAVVTSGTKHFVLKVVGTKTERREIRLGRRSRGWAEILEGIRAGDRVVREAFRDSMKRPAPQTPGRGAKG